jgi:MoCo/4Fe-4S cofactor protein with predicted Tat translocation signal
MEEAKDQRLDLEAVRAKLADQSGPKYWRTLEEVAETPEFQAWVDDEFPNRSTLKEINRRDLLKFMGASIALAGLTGCRGVFLDQHKIIPYVKQPEELVPGKPLYYATSGTLGGYATGLLVEQYEGRPIKIEGNPSHPASLGAVDSMLQAEILTLYDPDRVSTVRINGDIATWETFNQAQSAVLQAAEAQGGAGIRILTEATSSPTFGALMTQFLQRFPQARWHAFEPVGRAGAMQGAQQAFGQGVEPVYNLANARVIVSLDADFLSPAGMPGNLRYAREFANGRRVHGAQGQMNRLYAFESTLSIVGATADHRWGVRAADISSIARALAVAVGAGTGAASAAGISAREIQAVAADLMAGGGVVIPGENQPPAVHALAHSINAAIGAIGQTVNYIEPVLESARPDVGTLEALTQEMLAGQVEYLLIVGGNPVYGAPADVPFAQALQNVRMKAHLSMYQDETSRLCDWFLPRAHFLEAWGDARAYDGTVSFIQPLIAPLHESRSDIEVLGAMVGRPLGGYDLMRIFWQQAGLPGPDFETGWRTAVHDGWIPGTARQGAGVTPAGGAFDAAAPPLEQLEVNFRPDPTIYDGRYSNNGWLQETPKPITKLVWDNAAIVSPALAQERGLRDRDLIELHVGDTFVTMPVLIQPGQPGSAITVYLGYGRTAGGTLASEPKGKPYGGFNVNPLRRSNALNFAPVGIRRVAGSYELASTQGHTPLQDSRITDSRDIIREARLDAYNEDNLAARHPHELTPEELVQHNLYPEQIFEWDGEHWGMTIDMNTCIGCSACVTACVAENNIPVVGKEQVLRHREMHWLRVDRYYSGDDADPNVTWQPLMCVHCEQAPCEPVCPVAATVHSHDGLNQMIYNRCVGTRYCSNNCPYKVRRFNYLNYSDNQPNFAERVAADGLLALRDDRIPGPLHRPKAHGVSLLKLLNNPDVTVRGRGVMEKCTYCVQRINEARIEAKKEGRAIRDGEIVTACQQACPTQTIVFGNVADPNSAVSRLRQDPRAYDLLAELNTRPRTSHLAKLRNPNPALSPMPAPAAAHGGAH